MNAILDTGTSTTTLMLPIAEGEFGLKMGFADTPKAYEMPDKPGAATYEHKFASLNFGGVSVSNLSVAILPFPAQQVGGPLLGSRLGAGCIRTSSRHAHRHECAAICTSTSHIGSRSFISPRSTARRRYRSQTARHPTRRLI